MSKEKLAIKRGKKKKNRERESKMPVWTSGLS